MMCAHGLCDEAAFLWLNHEHGFFGSAVKKQELQVACFILLYFKNLIYIYLFIYLFMGS